MIESAEDESYLVDVSDGILQLTFNRPESGNATPSAALPGLIRLFQSAQSNQAIRCLVVAGRGKVFSSGGDIASFSTSLQQDVPTRQKDFERRLNRTAELVQAVIGFDRPIIAVIRGAAAGAGLLYPLAADYVLGDETASFVFAHQRVGLSPDGGVSYLLPRVVGERTARTLLLTTARLDAAEALRLGILSQVVQSSDLAAEATKIARKFSQVPQLAAKAAKTLINTALSNSVASHLKAEASFIVACVADPDFEEGVRSFLEKRSAKFPSAGSPREDQVSPDAMVLP